MSDENLIGRGRCPICGNGKARFTYSKSKLACMTCNSCNVQIFARSDNSDERMRAMVTTVGPGEIIDKVVEPARVAANDEKTEVKPAMTGTKKRIEWGFMGVSNG